MEENPKNQDREQRGPTKATITIRIVRENLMLDAHKFLVDKSGERKCGRKSEGKDCYSSLSKETKDEP
jgi:hypothetical protein